MSIEVKSNTDFQGTSLDWLGAFPRRWEVLPGLAVLQERQVKNVGLREKTVLSLSYGRVVVKPEEKLRGLVPESFETYQIVQPGNIIIRPTDLQNDHVSLRVGQVKDKGIITSAYICLETKGGLTPDYAHFLLLGYDLKKVFYGLGSGLRQNLSWTDFRRLPIPVPPADEQAQIVRFIRHLDHRVNRLIKTKRQLIELLNEQKQAIIHRAVTRGLDPTAPLKPSGIDWLGDVPEHWTIRKVSRTFKTTGSGTTPSTGNRAYYEDGQVPWVITGDLKNCELQTTSRFVTPLALQECSALKVFPAGSVIVAMYGATIGKVGLLRVPACVNQACCVLADSPFMSPEYAAQLFIAFRDDVVRLGVGGGQPNISQDIIKQLRLPVPPFDEQEAILKELGQSTLGLDQAVGKTIAEIDLIREYRTRLVADVVTGQLDVRHLDLTQVEESLIEAIDAVESDDPDEELEAQEVE